MPNCDFHVIAADHAPILERLFAENTCAIYELSFPGTLPEPGRLLAAAATRFAHLAFPEGETLHYKPQTK